MRVKGREEPDYSFQIPAPGWHNAVIQEGIDFLKKDGEDTVSAKGNRTIIVNMVIEGGEDNGKKVSIFAPYDTEFGELKLADLLTVTGLAPKFEEKFPGDVSLWDPKVFQAIQLKLPKNFLQVKLELTKDGKNVNVVNILAMGKKPKDAASKKEKAPVKGPEAGAPAGAAAPTAGNEGW
jgi:hypothetical protein